MSADHDNFLGLGLAGNFADDVQAVHIVVRNSGRQIQAYDRPALVGDEPREARIVLFRENESGRAWAICARVGVAL